MTWQTHPCFIAVLGMLLSCVPLAGTGASTGSQIQSIAASCGTASGGGIACLAIVGQPVSGMRATDQAATANGGWVEAALPLLPTRIIALSGDLAFGSVEVGETATRTLTIANSGNGALTVSGITYPAAFTGDWSGTIGPGSSTNVTVTFSPSSATNYGGDLSVSSDAIGGTGTMPVSGTGTVIPTRIIGLSGNLAFGEVQVGQTAARTLTISNAGNTTLTVSGISYPSGFSGGWSGTVGPGSSRVVTVTFSPSSARTYSGNLSVSSDATSGTSTLALGGTGTLGDPALRDASDALSLNWTTGGDANWFSQTSVTHDGVDAAQSGDVSNGQLSWLQTTVAGPGTISFWWRVSSEAGHDYLRFYVDNAEQAGSLSGEADWQQRTFLLPSGSRSLTWIYTKDGSGTAGSDCGWVDQIVFTPIAVRPGNTSSFSPQQRYYLTYSAHAFFAFVYDYSLLVQESATPGFVGYDTSLTYDAQYPSAMTTHVIYLYDAAAGRYTTAMATLDQTL